MLDLLQAARRFGWKFRVFEVKPCWHLRHHQGDSTKRWMTSKPFMHKPLAGQRDLAWRLRHSAPGEQGEQCILLLNS
ncbi:hypothetical protein [Polaromonas sp. CG_9.11]|uniref:hypothetical protein n=1 Tax=Polaromonas sp. CG_9.11 TaxID=2787730 RepID=UPI001A20D260|nr:hypothetical protein [Polaromonas sp. CG_9.11]MBG6077631.1 hypothetical protein [Polaromonas sp. CG_9.11]